MKVDTTLEKYRQFAKRKALLVTTKPVDVKVNKNAHTENSSAHMLKYTNPIHYVIVFSGGFYTRHKNNHYKLQEIIEHELAHIKEPYEHDAGFVRVAKNIGCARRYRYAQELKK